MFKKICSLAVFSFVIARSVVFAEIEYDIHDIGTLNTSFSQAIALNNHSQILGYAVDNPDVGAIFFVRDKDGSFLELPRKEIEGDCRIDWQYLTDNGKAYGVHWSNDNFTRLYMWDKYNGVVNLGFLPGKEVSAINNMGQVLIDVLEDENGKLIRRPVIWYNGKITKLNGLEDGFGIASEHSFGSAMNNRGEVVGCSLKHLVYKNEVNKKQNHATMWVGGKSIDLHKSVPKTNSSLAVAINDIGEVLVQTFLDEDMSYLVGKDKVYRGLPVGCGKMNNTGYTYGNKVVVINGVDIITIEALSQKVQQDFDSIWLKVIKIISVNDNGEIIALGETIYGEEHAMLLTPVKLK